MTRREMDQARDWFRNYADCLETELENEGASCNKYYRDKYRQGLSCSRSNS